MARVRGVQEAVGKVPDSTTVTIIVAPPLATGPEGLLLADGSTQIVMVIRQGHTTYPAVVEAIRVFRSAGVHVSGLLIATHN